MIVELEEVVGGEWVREWCRLPYPDHPNGCPNYSKKQSCPPNVPMYHELVREPYYLVVQEFDLEAQEKRMLAKHPDWTKRQARCCLYWQKGLMKEIMREAQEFLWQHPDCMILKSPEANGVNLYVTCARHGIHLERINAGMKIVRKMVMVACRK